MDNHPKEFLCFTGSHEEGSLSLAVQLGALSSDFLVGIWIWRMDILGQTSVDKMAVFTSHAALPSDVLCRDVN